MYNNIHIDQLLNALAVLLLMRYVVHTFLNLLARALCTAVILSLFLGKWLPRYTVMLHGGDGNMICQRQGDCAFFFIDRCMYGYHLFSQ